MTQAQNATAAERKRGVEKMKKIVEEALAREFTWIEQLDGPRPSGCNRREGERA